MPRVLGIALEPVPGVRLACHSSSGSGVTHANPDACGMVVHHDHMLDYIHSALLDKLSPRVPGHPHGRPDYGKAFSNFLRSQRKVILERVMTATTPSGSPIVRFRPTHVCELLNAVDGNSKLRAKEARPDEGSLIRFWSMTPDELRECVFEKKTWDDIYDADRGGRNRRDAVDALVRTLIADYRRGGE